MGDMAELMLFLPRPHIRLRLRSSSATILPPKRNGGVKAEHALLILACLRGFLLSITSGLLRKDSDFSLEANQFMVEDGSAG